MFANTATTYKVTAASARPSFGARRGPGASHHAPLSKKGKRSAPLTAPHGMHRGTSTTTRVFSPDRAAFPPSPDNDDLTKERVTSESIVRAAHKAERQRAALRTARSAQGVARAESLRVGIEHRCAHSLMDALPVDDVLGGESVGLDTDAVIRKLASACDQQLAQRFGVKQLPGGSPEADLDMAVLFALQSRMDTLSQNTLLSGTFKHRNAKVLSSLMLNDETYVQRFEVRSVNSKITRDKVLLTATFSLDERLAPCFKSASVVQQWALRSVTGELVEEDMEEA